MSAPDASSAQFATLTAGHMASLYVGATQVTNTGLQGAYVDYWHGDVPAADIDLARANVGTVRDLPPDQSALIIPPPRP